MFDLWEGLCNGCWLSGCLWALAGMGVCLCVGLVLVAGG